MKHPSVGEWLNCGTPTQWNIYLKKEKWLIYVTTWIDLKRTMLNGKKGQYKRLYTIDSIYIEFLKVHRWEQISDLQELDVVGRKMEVIVKGRCGTFVGMIDGSYTLLWWW